MERITRAKAIRLKCLDCSAGQPSEVRKCELATCPLWRDRMGKEIKDDQNSEYADDFEDED